MSDNEELPIPADTLALILQGRQRMRMDITKHPEYKKWVDVTFYAELRKWFL